MRNLLFSIFVLALAALASPGGAQTVFGFPLEEGQEVPPTGSAAVGTCVARLNPTETELTVTCQHDVASVTAAHIHNAPAGANGGIVFPFASPVSVFRGVWSLTPADVAELFAGNLYVNVHSMAFPGGEIRGQIGPPTATGFAFDLEEGQEVPPTGSLATGTCDAVLDDPMTTLTTACAHDVANVTAAHIHNAPPGANGAIVFPFASPVSPFLGVWGLSAGDVANLLAGDLYVNVHSTAFPGGEIRGQILPAIDVVFGDGFETGDTTRWSQTIPSAP